MDIVVAMGACTNGNYASQYGLPGTFAPIADFGLLKKAVEECEKSGVLFGNEHHADGLDGRLLELIVVVGVGLEDKAFARGVALNYVRTQPTAERLSSAPNSSRAFGETGPQWGWQTRSFMKAALGAFSWISRVKSSRAL